MEDKNKTFKVIHCETKKEIEGAFILLPEHDSSARVALATYAEATTNLKIARWLRAWLHEIHKKREDRRRNNAE